MIDPNALKHETLFYTTDVVILGNMHPDMEFQVNQQLLGLAEKGKNKAVLRMDNFDLFTSIEMLLSRFDRDTFIATDRHYYIVVKW